LLREQYIERLKKGKEKKTERHVPSRTSAAQSVFSVYEPAQAFRFLLPLATKCLMHPKYSIAQALLFIGNLI
jgi:hypothetical protein